MNQPGKELKTVFIIAAGVPGDKSVESMAIYYRGIVQPYEMTFNPNGAKRFSTKAKAEAFRRTLEGSHRFTVVEHVLYRQIVK
ncbi:hypothetical protein [Larkinella punicea]|uniref:Uncharacterized protein n=1 Tax=Larkinella punicea TaxID=2315727 RepID=A0A368JH85_9BACT|nr:hypothetical protein [Larkinella punicea]RCR67029.1 hypothetical protein DUE52_23515 [Larkinella punicea]